MKHFYLTVLSFFSFFQVLGQNPAINFDGTNDFIQTTFEGVTGSADRTFEAWVYVDPGAPASNLCILDYGLNAAGDRNTFSVSGTRKLSFLSGGTNANISSTNNNAVPEGQWTHVAFVLDAGTGYLYVNGVQVGTGSLSSVSTPTTGSDMRIGQRVAGGSILFNGSIDEVRVYNVARTATEIMADMNSEICSLTSSLVAYYRMNDGVINGVNTGTIIDNSGNNNTGTLNNFALSGTGSNWTTGPVLGGGFTNSSLVVNTCSDYTGPTGTVYTTSGVYTETTTNTAGCDSIIQIDLTVAPLTSTIDEIVCDSYISPSGTYTWTASGLYADTLTTASGCDSVISINLTVDNYETTVFAQGCGSYTSMSGNNTWTSSGMYFEVFPSVNGCDSVINYDLTINSNSTSTLNESICLGDTYTSPSGMTYTTAGTYTDMLTNANNCDSIITINLTVTDVNADVTASAATLTADLSGATYQWYECENGNLTILPGETNQSFTANVNGDYAVEVTSGDCSSASTCYTVDFTSVSEVSQLNANIYPNPSNGIISIALNKVESAVTVNLINMQGKILLSKNLIGTDKVFFYEGLPTGIYFVVLEAGNNSAAYKVIVL